MRPASLFRGVVGVLLLSLWRGSSAADSGMFFVRHPEPLAAPLGDEVYFECALNLPADSFAWRHRPLGSERWGPLTPLANAGGRPDNKMSKYVVSFDERSKAGDYQCIAYYGTIGLASDPARLSLATLEDFAREKDEELRVAAGNTVPITCPVPHSCPRAIVQFYKGDAPIEDAVLTGGETMVLENVTAADAGRYSCEATNYISSQTRRSRGGTVLSVIEGDAAQPPYFVKQPRAEYRVLPGRNVTLECFGAGSPVPRVTWSRIGSHLPAKVRYTAAGLSIRNVQPSDRGQYHCRWNNGHDAKQYAILLRVVERPRVTKPLSVPTASEGGDLELSCSVSGEPEPGVEWLINGEFVPNGREKGSRFLSISPVGKEHAGIVQCVASNEYGSDSGYALLEVTPKQHLGGVVVNGPRRDQAGPGSVPSHREHTRIGGRRRPNEAKRKDNAVLVPPAPPNVTRLSDTSVMVRWSVPKKTGLPIQFFKVQYRELGQKMNGQQGKWMTSSMVIPHHVRSFEVGGLQPNHTYRFRIAAVYSNNDNMLSPNSVKFLLNRDPGFEANRMPIPLLTNTEAIGPREILLDWHTVDEASAEIDGFYVYHRAATSAGEYVKTTVEGKNATTIVISHLEPDTAYEFKVQSFSVDAASEFSRIFKRKTLPLPLPVESPVQRVVAETKERPGEADRAGSLYAIVGGALGGVALLAALAVVAVLCKPRCGRERPREAPESQGKAAANGRVGNGDIAESKINITPNPLAGLDAPEDGIPKNGQRQSTMEMASFLNGQNNNSRSNGDPAASRDAAGEPSAPRRPSANEQPL